MHDCSLIASDDLIVQARRDGAGEDELSLLTKYAAQSVRGIEQPIDLWIER